MSKKQEDHKESTEAKIKRVAREMFHSKGYAATRTRDIAEAADINLALLNYYFRSKENLFKQIMYEALGGFLENIGSVFNDPTSTLEQKVAALAERYIDQLNAEPEIPLFIMSEIRQDPEAFLEKAPMKRIIMQSVFIAQYQEALEQGKVTEPNPMHFMMNLLSLIVFPFTAAPLLKKVGQMDDRAYAELMEQRKALIPQWVGTMFFTPNPGRDDS